MRVAQDKLRERIHQDLLNLVDNTLADAEIGPGIKKLLSALGVTVDELKKEVLAYTLAKGVSEYHNDQYQKNVARLTLYFHNLVRGTYHRRRHEFVSAFLNRIKPKTLMDVGFGVPGPYLLPYLQNNPGATAILADQDPSAEDTARVIMSSINPELLKQVKFIVYDMNTQEYPGDVEAYLHLDSVEHTKNPTEYLRKMVRAARLGSHFIFSIPVCSMKGLEGFHYYEWLTDVEVLKWLEEAGLFIKDSGAAIPNFAVDYFVELVEGGYHNFMVLAQKI
ncbi:MAG: hypothetical protein AAB468_01000 [Patescibacteria group bacterium]